MKGLSASVALMAFASALEKDIKDIPSAQPLATRKPLRARLPARAYQNKVDPAAEAAAERMEKMGGSPRIQLEAAKFSSGQRNLTYKPHNGAKEKARRLAALEKSDAV